MQFLFFFFTRTTDAEDVMRHRGAGQENDTSAHRNETVHGGRKEGLYLNGATETQMC